MQVKSVINKILTAILFSIAYLLTAQYDFNVFRIGYSSILGSDWSFVSYFSLYIVYLSIFSLANMKDYIFCRVKHRGKAVLFVNKFMIANNVIYAVISTFMLYLYQFVVNKIFILKYPIIFCCLIFMAITLIAYFLSVVQIYFTKSTALIASFGFVLINLVSKMCWLLYVTLQQGDNYFLKPLYLVSKTIYGYGDIIDGFVVFAVWIGIITILELVLRKIVRNKTAELA